MSAGDTPSQVASGMQITLGEYIGRVRTEKGWSQKDLAKRCQISASQIQRLEDNQVKSPGLSLILSLKKALGLTLPQLIAAYEGRDPEQLAPEPDPLLLDLLQLISKHTPPDLLVQHIVERYGPEALSTYSAQRDTPPTP